MNPRFPIYILSKGRWESRMTARYLEAMHVPFFIVVEPQERDSYASVIDPEKVLTVPWSDRHSVPVRNWIWEHSIERGFDWHWCLDDNIRGFYRFNHNLKTPVTSGTIFATAEDFVLRYENVGQAGFNYFMFVVSKGTPPPFYLNTRVYSCILNRNDVRDRDGKPIRWRELRFNEDTDLSLQVLSAGYSTVLFNAFLADKMKTLMMKGGNTEAYKTGEGRKHMAEVLVERWPEIARVSWKFGRWQHHVDYSGFAKNYLRRRSDVEIPKVVNNFGMKLQQEIPRGSERWFDVDEPVFGEEVA